MLEGILGLRRLGAPGWDPTGVVSEVSIATRDLWSNPMLEGQRNLRTVAGQLYQHMRLDSIIDQHAYDSYAAKIAQKTSLALSIGCKVGFWCDSLVYEFL